jgi:hypothetical protein
MKMLMKMEFLSSCATDTSQSQVTESDSPLSSVSKDETVITMNKEHQLHLMAAKRNT